MVSLEPFGNLNVHSSSLMGLKYFASKDKSPVPNFFTRQLILSVLVSSATKREAKDYLEKYKDGALKYCILYLRDVSTYTQDLLDSFVDTVATMEALGIRLIFVLDPDGNPMEECNRLQEKFLLCGINATPVSGLLSKKRDGSVSLSFIPPLDVTLIILPFIYKEESAMCEVVTDKAEFMGNLVHHIPYEIDKFFIINKVGGIPSNERNNNSHVFINLSQEYESLLEELNGRIESENANKLSDNNFNVRADIDRSSHVALIDHMEDLKMMHGVLCQLSRSSTGAITSIWSAVKRTNPLLYNLLTDRALISPSLPRFKSSEFLNQPFKNIVKMPQNKLKDPALSTTILKNGINIEIFDFQLLSPENTVGLPLNKQYSQDFSVGDSISKNARKLDIRKVKRLIENTFERPLNLNHYLDRINGHIASIIVIGDYEGIAILTYEGPKDRRFVYLDKFAIMPHLRGSLCIADVIFNLMFKKFPKEVLWRSRRENIINKWYFQRSTGVLDLSINLGGQNQKSSLFKLFYYGTTEDNTFEDCKRLGEYASYVRDIVPSWI
ncbi:HBR366Wp [Eremothecium sinecaudum]|uniref:Amino-acid acetyltransferase, mitochondrial n=1 Tax=Eremothecium sinecaudum TaxID=45286 RepID=A0A109UY42_9SACH|nr:HBR366Wp [Eremothecium sinecaudum]AMD19267.1 HBR366Wp [Eremothecium sinecaudum]